MPAAPWAAHACYPPSEKPKGGNAGVMRQIHHVTHTTAALRIIDDGRISRGRIFDKSKLTETRTAVVWLSPNEWAWGSRYGNVQFSFDFAKLAKGRRMFWVEEMAYSPVACRLMLTTEDLAKKFDVTPYEPETDKGPVRLVDGKWWRHTERTVEIMLDGHLPLSSCVKLDFIAHHSTYCAVDPASCPDLGKPGVRASARVMAHLLARGDQHLGEALREGAGKDVLSTPADFGVLELLRALAVEELDGAIEEAEPVGTILKAALLQFAAGDKDEARETIALLKNEAVAIEGLQALVKNRLGVGSDLLKQLA